MSNSTVADFYRQQSCFSTPGDLVHLFKNLPDDLPQLCRVVRGVYIHYRAKTLPPTLHHRLGEVDTRYTSRILERILHLDERDLTIVRSVDNRFIGCCRDVSLLLCSILRSKGVSARIRIGFATYIHTDAPFPYTDHVVTEYWDIDEKRWKLIDAEQDETLIDQNQITFDVHDIPHDKFIPGGRAWQMGRENHRLWEQFGVNDHVKGRWFVAGYLIRDFAALNLKEVLLWDTWGLMKSFDDLSETDLALLDRIAALTQANEVEFETIRATYEAHPQLMLPETVMVYSPVSDWREETLICN